MQAVRRWVRLSCTEPGTHLPALDQIAGELRLPAPVVRAALEQLAADGLVTLHDSYRLYSVGTTTPAERAYRLMRTAIHRSYAPGERFMTRDRITQTFGIGTKEAAAAVRQLVAEGLLTGPRGQYVNAYSPAQQRRRVKATARARQRPAPRGPGTHADGPGDRAGAARRRRRSGDVAGPRIVPQAGVPL
ncbi:GntR family transcriptional regulator [Streptomyces decoyicus]|uniref:GntR family transcriptional regulator n=1 Tax=Streptomyces decoyicus TaxID=249567 RepID=UPI00365BEF87